MATWAEVQGNPTLYPLALVPGEGEQLRWHTHADKPHSSQVFCVSAFGTLRQLLVRNQIIQALLEPFGTPGGEAAAWSVEMEAVRPDLLSEYGQAQASSVDALLLSRQSVFAVESKFLSDALSGFGECSQPKKQCEGFYGPGSDLKTHTNAWCRLEVWDGDRSPRTYWSLGKAYFQESLFAKQSSGEICPLSGPNYQLMRNFLFAAALAQQQKIPSFGVVVIAPKRVAGKLESQIDAFCTDVLQPPFRNLVQLTNYERLIELLVQSGDAAGFALATFLSSRIAAHIP